VKPDRRGKFVALAETRVNKAINCVRLIGNLSNRSNYSYTDDDVAKIYRALKKSLDEMKARFDSKGAGTDRSFKL
jgi:hypothetical protein